MKNLIFIIETFREYVPDLFIMFLFACLNLINCDLIVYYVL